MQSCSSASFASRDISSLASGESSPIRAISTHSINSTSPNQCTRLEDQLQAASRRCSTPVGTPESHMLDESPRRWAYGPGWGVSHGGSRPSTPTRYGSMSSAAFRHPSSPLPEYQSLANVMTPNSLARSRRLSSANTYSFGSNNFKSLSDLSRNKYQYSASTGAPTSTSDNEATLEYLADLVKEKKNLGLFPHMFNHVDRLLEDEIGRVRVSLFQTDLFAGGEIELPEPMGETVTVTEKIYVPTKEYPEYNFVGRILGPRGMTAKQLEQETGCKIMVRGKGSMRDKKKQEDSNRGRPNWEHLDDDLHVLLQCEDTENRVHVKLRAAIEQVKKLLVPAPEGTDELKRKQLMELAIINGTYRPLKSLQSPTRVMTAVPLLSPVRSNSPAVLMSPSPSAPPSPTLPPTNFLGANAFDYSALLNSSLFETALASMQLGDVHIPNYPTTTSFVNSFPSLFATPNSQRNGGDNNGSSSRSNSQASY